MTKITNQTKTAIFNQILAALNGVRPVDGSKILSRTATTLEVEAKDGTVYKIEGENLTYFTDATATTGAKGVSDIGQPASGFITSLSISGALPKDSFQLDDVNFTAQTLTELWSDVVNSRGFSSRYSPDKLGDFGEYVMTEIDTVVGTDQNDYIDLSVKTKVRRTDKLFEDGHDKVSGGKGDDTIIAGSGKDVIEGGNGNDSLYGDYASIRSGGSFQNNFQFSRGDNDVISGGKGNDTIFGGGGNDTIDGGQGNDTMHGGWGSDIFTLSDGNDVIDGYTDSSRGYGTDKASDLVNLNKTFKDFTSISYEMQTIGTEIPVFTFTYKDAAGQTHTTTIQRVEQFKFADKTLSVDQLISQIDGGTNPTENLVKDVAGEVQYLTGTTDNDIFVINGNSADYGWDKTDDGQGIVVWNKDHFDVLEGFEAISFNDQTVSLQSITPVTKVVDIAGQTQYLTGTTENDSFVIEGKVADYGIDRTDDGKGFVVWNDNSFDVLNDFEMIEFQDQTITLGDDFSA